MRVFFFLKKEKSRDFQAVDNQCTSQCLVIKCEKKNTKKPLDKEKIQ